MRPGVRAKIAIVATFAACFLLYVWKNNFPFFYHSDEESKTLQVMQHYRNLWHPLLLVNLTDWAARLLSLDSEQSVTRCGRFISAFFAATGVAAMTLLALRRHGLAAAATFALFWGTLPLFFEVAHYFKEDAAWLMGLSLVLLGLDFLQRKIEPRSIIFLAFACAIAASAKYIGFLLLPVAMIALLRQTGRVRNVGIFLSTFLAFLLAVNWHWLTAPLQLWQGLTRETGLLEGGHYGMSGVSAASKYAEIFSNNVAAWMGAFGIFGVGICCWRKRPFEILLAAGGGVFFVMLCLLVKTSDRYLLPALLVCFYFFSIGLAQLAGWVSGFIHPRVLPVFILAAWWPQFTVLEQYCREFRTDSRAELAAWIKQHLPSQARVATSLWTRLPGFYEGQLTTGIAPADFASDCGSLAQLREMGVGYVAVAGAEYSRFSLKGKTAETGVDAHFFRRRDFYLELMDDRRLLWEKSAGRIYILHPGLRLYAVPE